VLCVSSRANPLHTYVIAHSFARGMANVCKKNDLPNLHPSRATETIVAARRFYWEILFSGHFPELPENRRVPWTGGVEKRRFSPRVPERDTSLRAVSPAPSPSPVFLRKRARHGSEPRRKPKREFRRAPRDLRAPTTNQTRSAQRSARRGSSGSPFSRRWSATEINTCTMHDDVTTRGRTVAGVVQK
jgi:hypothetical protein